MVSEGYVRDAVFYRLIPLPVDMDLVDESHMEKTLEVDHVSLSNLKKTLDTFSHKHGFVVKQMYRTTSNAKWACRPKFKAPLVAGEDEREETMCTFTINANVRKHGGVFITSMNLNHNHPLVSDDAVPAGPRTPPDTPDQHAALLDSTADVGSTPRSAKRALPAVDDDGDVSVNHSWMRNIVRARHASSGFWGNARWYDLQLARRLPLVPTMLEQMLLAMPPVGTGSRVADLCAGSGACSEKVLGAYPEAEVFLFDASKERLDMAVRRLSAMAVHHGGQAARVSYFKEDLYGVSILRKAPFDVIVASLAVHVLVERPAHYGGGGDGNHDPAIEHKRVFQLIFNSLAPNGHVILGDHVGMAPLFAQLKWMEEIGFVDVDCAWRQDDFFVVGGRRPAALPPHVMG
ncbi:Aste57867_12989 [Aphanomyces stellatus]|uniref:Aste57867_12989 protein n=1 Tax=Aphanomyces stellatus TaxID=120398 RepID=A0A485KX16_9STRA|nr:hypothetical protein As57867_012941 [Aphanomyces stellatus]VFT89835.1 Aste57867_12989 [Aphanomyces stellatus]